MPADEPTEGDIEFNGKKYKCVFNSFKISEHVDTDAFCDGCTEKITATFSGMLSGGYDEPGDYRDRLHNPPQN